MADDGGHHDHDQGRFKHNNLEEGTLGWAEYGLYPGLYGFSLRWHLGYGYGLYALGVGADGGYPFYAGPGYPHEPPHLNRCGPESPYAYFGGPDDSLFGGFNFYQPVGGLAVTKPVVGIGEPGDFGFVGENGERNPGADFASFTGAIPYPETQFAPYASAAATTGSSGAEGSPKPTTCPPHPLPRYLVVRRPLVLRPVCVSCRSAPSGLHFYPRWKRPPAGNPLKWEPSVCHYGRTTSESCGACGSGSPARKNEPWGTPPSNVLKRTE